MSWDGDGVIHQSFYWLRMEFTSLHKAVFLMADQGNDSGMGIRHGPVDVVDVEVVGIRVRVHACESSWNRLP